LYRKLGRHERGKEIQITLLHLREEVDEGRKTTADESQ
jgi:hypothetical protein